MLTGDSDTAERLLLHDASSIKERLIFVGFIFIFLNALITFPYYWFTAAIGFFNFFVRRQKANWLLIEKWFLGFCISMICFFLTFYIGIKAGIMNAT